MTRYSNFTIKTRGFRFENNFLSSKLLAERTWIPAFAGKTYRRGSNQRTKGFRLENNLLISKPLTNRPRFLPPVQWPRANGESREAQE